jgi:hypothetical protein
MAKKTTSRHPTENNGYHLLVLKWDFKYDFSRETIPGGVTELKW